MASSAQLKIEINPLRIFLVAFAASAVLFVIGIFALNEITFTQNQKLLQYELSVLLKSQGKFLADGQYREFAQLGNLGQDPWSLNIQDTVKKSSFNANSQDGFISVCAYEQYLQFDVTLCRPRIIPWNYLAILAGLYLLVIFLATVALLRANKSLINSFRAFFEAANLGAPDRLTFAGAWRFANRMAEQFKDLQKQSVELGRIKAREQIASQVAHDIRSPVSALNIVAASINGATDEQRAIIKGAAKRINDIANSLLNKKKAQPTEIGKVLGSIIDEKRTEIARSDLELILEADEQREVWSNVDESDLSRVISNLINNSVEAGGGKIAVRLQSSDQITISVSDDGSGIPAEHLPNVGRYGVSFGKSRSESGSGMGLFHAKSVVEASGGSLIIDSLVGKGTTVSIQLPKTIN